MLILDGKNMSRKKREDLMYFFNVKYVGYGEIWFQSSSVFLQPFVKMGNVRAGPAVTPQPAFLTGF